MPRVSHSKNSSYSQHREHGGDSGAQWGKVSAYLFFCAVSATVLFLPLWRSCHCRLGCARVKKHQEKKHQEKKNQEKKHQEKNSGFWEEIPGESGGRIPDSGGGSGDLGCARVGSRWTMVILG